MMQDPSTERTRRRHRLPRVCIVLAVLVIAGPPAPRPVYAATRPALRAPHGIVVAPEAEAARVGLDVLRGGGNAVDAAVAVSLALAVTYPRAGNLGGGGFLLYRDPESRAFALDFRETAPAALTARHFLDAGGRPVPDRSLAGGLSVGVPGSVAGLAEAHRLWGSIPWRRLVAPAIRLAQHGVRVSRRSAETFENEITRLGADPAARALFTRDGSPLREGDRLVQRDLARTLRRIARSGKDGFYRGPVAEAIARTVKRSGGVLVPEDLAAYRAVSRAPLEGSYRGHRVLAFPPPSSGGVALLQMLAMLERFDLRASGAGSSLTVHRVVEASRRAFADRARWLGDPDFFAVPVSALLDPAYLEARGAGIRDDRAAPASEVVPGSWPAAVPATETLHLSVADTRGGTVALTTTLNSWYGAALVAEGTGVLLNNEMDDFALAPMTPNQFGLVGGAANAVEPRKRPLSSMCPTIVERPGGGPRPLLVLGSPGGPTIITSVLQVLVDVIDLEMPIQEAVDAPRFHHQWVPDRIDHEARALPEDVAAGLRARGHTLAVRPAIGNVAAIGIDRDGAWLGAPDPRDEAVAAGY